MTGLDVEAVLRGVLSEWQIIGVRAEHDPSCNGDCIDRCPIPVQYALATDEAVAHVAAILRVEIETALGDAWDEGRQAGITSAVDCRFATPNPYRPTLAATEGDRQ